MGEACADELGTAASPCGLLALPCRGILPAEGAVMVHHSAPALYIPGVAAVTQPACFVKTDTSCEAFVRLLRPRGNTTQQPAGKAPAAKRVAGQAAAGAAASKKTKLSSTPSSVAPTVLAPTSTAAATVPSDPQAQATTAGALTASTSADPHKSTYFPATGKQSTQATQGTGSAPQARVAARLLAASLQQQGAGQQQPQHHEQDALRRMPVKDLKELCKARGLPVSGTKEQLAQRVIEWQRRQKQS